MKAIHVLAALLLALALVTAPFSSANAQSMIFDELHRMMPADCDSSTSMAVIGNYLFVGNSGMQNRLYMNNGTGFFIDATSQIPVDGDDSRAVAAGDVDGDGDLDVLIGNYGIISYQYI